MDYDEYFDGEEHVDQPGVEEEVGVEAIGYERSRVDSGVGMLVGAAVAFLLVATGLLPAWVAMGGVVVFGGVVVLLRRLSTAVMAATRWMCERAVVWGVVGALLGAVLGMGFRAALAGGWAV